MSQEGVQPTVIELAAGTYFWCRCGQTAHPPFCDGSHRKEGTQEPLRFSLERDRRVALCNCKRTGNPPYCDGSHAT